MNLEHGQRVTVRGLPGDFRYVEPTIVPGKACISPSQLSTDPDVLYLYVNPERLSPVAPPLPPEPTWLGSLIERSVDGQTSKFVRVEPGYGSKNPAKHWFRIQTPAYANGRVTRRWYTWAELNEK